MPRQKDLKRIVRSRMQKTGESYTAARMQVLRKTEAGADYAARAGLGDAAVAEKTGRHWAEWIKVLDAAGCAKKPHREIARYVASLGLQSWWAQTVTVGYERIRGLREIGQLRGGGYRTNKSRTFAVPVERLFKAFADSRLRKRWLPEKVVVRTANPNRTMRVTWEDATSVEIGFTAKAAGRSAVAVQHSKLPDKAAAARMKELWTERLAALAQVLA